MSKIKDVETAAADFWRENAIPINLLASAWIGQQNGKHPLIAIGACLVTMQAMIDAMVASVGTHEQGAWRAGLQQTIERGLANFERLRQRGLDTPAGHA